MAFSIFSRNNVPQPKQIDVAPETLRAQEMVPTLKAYIKEEYTWTPGASAVVKDIPLAKAPIAAIILNWDMLGAGGAATFANALTQCGTKVYLKDGGTKITPEWTLAELAEYHKAALGIDAPFQDGTAADNKLALLQVVLICGRPVYRPIFPVALIDPQVAFKPSNTPYLHVEIPADGNSIDNRQLKVTVIYHPMGESVPYNKYWTDWTEQTVSTSGVTDWTIADRGAWLETMLFQTSEYNATLTSDAPSIKNIEVEMGSVDVVFSGAVNNVLGSLLDTDVTSDDQYLFNSFSYRNDPLSLCPAFDREARFRITGGVADAVKAAFSIIHRK